MQNQYAQSSSQKFRAGLSAAVNHCRSFAACVRDEFDYIDQALKEGASLETLADLLSKSYGVPGSASALKSALLRLRSARRAEIDREWVDGLVRTSNRDVQPAARSQPMQAQPQAQPSGLGLGASMSPPNTYQYPGHQPSFQQSAAHYPQQSSWVQSVQEYPADHTGAAHPYPYHNHHQSMVFPGQTLQPYQHYAQQAPGYYSDDRGQI